MSMQPFIVWRGVAAPMLRANIDTDAIIPSREMKLVSKLGLGDGLFADERYLDAEKRSANPDFVLNQPHYADCSILLAGENFGCGSSREHAVWALKEYGVRSIIAPSFGTIFANNCVRNGLLPVSLPRSTIETIVEWVREQPAQNQPSIDLKSQRVSAGGITVSFEIDNSARQMLLQGLDAIALTLTRWSAIEAFHDKRRAERPWLYLSQ